MANLNLPNIREGGDIRFRIGLEDGGVAVDWTSLEDIRVFLYSDVQKQVSGECEIGVDATDDTVLECLYSGDDVQYRGINSVLVRAKYMDDIKVYDKPAINIVPRTSEATGVIVIDDPVVPVQISVEEVSTSLLDNAIDAAILAADRAERAAEAAEHMVDIHTGPAGKSPYIGENGHWYEWDEETSQYVDTEEEAQGEPGVTPDITIGTVTTAEPGTPAAATMTGTPEAPVLNLTIPKGVAGDTPAFTVGEVTTGQPGTPVIVTITGTAAAPVLNIQIPQGMQGNTGSSVDYPYELVNNLTTNDATKGLTAAQGKVLKDELTQLEHEVHNLSGKYYGVFEDSLSLPEGDAPGYAFVGTESPFAIYNYDGDAWADSGATVDGIQGEPGVGFGSISTPSTPDGTAVITLSNGDTITLDLNHEHAGYFSKVLGGAMPVGGFLPDVVYSLGTLSGAITFSLASPVTGNVNHYFWMFDTGVSAPTVTWPAGLTWADGSAPTVSASKHYEISVLGGVAYYSEV